MIYKIALIIFQQALRKKSITRRTIRTVKKIRRK